MDKMHMQSRRLLSLLRLRSSGPRRRRTSAPRTVQQRHSPCLAPTPTTPMFSLRRATSLGQRLPARQEHAPGQDRLPAIPVTHLPRLSRPISVTEERQSKHDRLNPGFLRRCARPLVAATPIRARPSPAMEALYWLPRPGAVPAARARARTPMRHHGPWLEGAPSTWHQSSARLLSPASTRTRLQRVPCSFPHAHRYPCAKATLVPTAAALQVAATASIHTLRLPPANQSSFLPPPAQLFDLSVSRHGAR